MEEEMMQKSVRYNAVAAIIPASFLSVVFLISAVHFNVAQANSMRLSLFTVGVFAAIAR